MQPFHYLQLKTRNESLRFVMRASHKLPTMSPWVGCLITHQYLPREFQGTQQPYTGAGGRVNTSTNMFL